MSEVRKGYKLTELGEIPIEWNILTLGNVSKRITTKNKGLISENVLTISAQYGLVSQTEFFNKKVASSNLEGYYLLEKDDFAYNKSYSKGYPMGAIKPLTRYDNGVVSTLYICFRLNSELNTMYFKNYFDSNLWHKEVAEIAQEGARNHGLLNVAVNEFFGIKIIVPTVEEQQKIALILSTVDEQIDETEQLIVKTQELKKGLMQQLLTKGIGHTEFKQTELGEIPNEWKVVSFFNEIEEVYDYRGRTPKKIGLEWGNGNIRALSANNVKNGYIDFDAECYLASEELYRKWMTKGDLVKDDVLFTMEAPLGNVTLVPDNNKYILSQRVVAFRTSSNLNPHFFVQFLRSEKFKELLNTFATGTTAKGVSQKNLAKVQILLPNLKEQQKIASILSTVDEQIKVYEREKAKYEELKKGLMQQLLTGQIRVKI
ncbi:restriction endonuclease subunit S [Lysinibacillus capsici]|uniref:restriction endonuclease subunit S n=1 Tax=Lysinibacillus capsici TaxID=2115968 RepID=UPI001CD94257|nr:restriction endonuclease subunit S [Lysinibacillus capsici]